MTTDDQSKRNKDQRNLEPDNPQSAIRNPQLQLTHLDDRGNARMVDVGSKPDTERSATARGEVTLSQATLDLIRDGKTPKGDVLAVARVAGIMAAKRTPDLVPLCHPIMLTSVHLDFELQEWGIEITAIAKTVGPTGVEMEALTAVSVAALTIYDMLKAVERNATITNIRLEYKEGGKSGVWKRNT
jgi:cyclic pyranopterin monophosphate synthase